MFRGLSLDRRSLKAPPPSLCRKWTGPALYAGCEEEEETHPVLSEQRALHSLTGLQAVRRSLNASSVHCIHSAPDPAADPAFRQEKKRHQGGQRVRPAGKLLLQAEEERAMHQPKPEVKKKRTRVVKR